MFGSLLETEDEGEYARDTSGQDFANFDVRTEVENANLLSEKSGSYLLFKFSSLLQNFSISFVRLARLSEYHII